MLQIKNLTKVFPTGTVALNNVSFEVHDGEYLAVIGLSGSGKSTLLRCINRLIDPTSGEVIWNEHNITSASGAELRRMRRQIGMIFQQPGEDQRHRGHDPAAIGARQEQNG